MLDANPQIWELQILEIFVYAIPSDAKDITYLLTVDKKRCAVLVYKLVAAVGVDMSHFCAVNVEWHLVLINSQSFRVHSWVSTQDMSARGRTGA